MRENKFQSNLIKELKERFPGCLILKNDPNYIQGIPDLLVLFHNKWASLECKKSENELKKKTTSIIQQRHYVDQMNEMSYSSFIYPENKEDVLSELERTFES